MFAALRHYNYRIWFAAALVGNVGTWMQRVAQDWLVLTILTSNSGTAVGIVTALQFLPALVLSPMAGLLADRMNRRKLVIITQASMGLSALVLGMLVLTGHAQLWQVYILALSLGVASAFDGPARQTVVAELVPAERLANAVSLNAASFNAARLIGPGVAGLLIAAVGPGWVFIINAVSFAATIVALWKMRTAELTVLPRASREKGQIRQAVRYIRARGDIVVIMAVVFVASMLGLNFQLTSAMMATETFAKGAGEYGVLGSILAIGSLSGALLAARRKQPRVRLVVGAAFGFAVSMGVMAAMPTYLTYALMCIPVGFFSLTMLTSANGAIQTTTAPQMRGRVMSLYLMVLLGATPLGSPVVGWIGEHWGARWSIWIGAIATGVAAIIALIWTQRRWHYRIVLTRKMRPFLQVTYPQLQVATVSGRLS
ncbi:Predicted arabinose efflux permease, MFS family [Micrococcales bacterium KH10]|nr:Predicted arabinose efflux permease, MFS family [Micrococcales bacterium KH10]